MSADIGPGTPLICVNDASSPGLQCRCPEHTVTLHGLYFCEEVIKDPIIEATGSRICPWDSCGTTGLAIKGKRPFVFCPNLFRPLNDGDTSLVQDEITINDYVTSKDLANV